jgi:hypothetical protein
MRTGAAAMFNTNGGDTCLNAYLHDRSDARADLSSDKLLVMSRVVIAAQVEAREIVHYETPADIAAGCSF